MAKIFIHEGQGHYIGSVVVVIAEDKPGAESQIRAYLDEAGLPNELVDIKKEIDLKNPVSSIVYAQNGDY